MLDLALYRARIGQFVHPPGTRQVSHVGTDREYSPHITASDLPLRWSVCALWFTLYLLVTSVVITQGNVLRDKCYEYLDFENIVYIDDVTVRGPLISHACHRQDQTITSSEQFMIPANSVKLHLILSHDVETNPGPQLTMKDLNAVKAEIKTDILNEIREFRQSMCTEMSAIKSQIREVAEKCSSLDNSLSDLQVDIDRVTNEQVSIYTDIDAMNQKFENLESVVLRHESELDKLECFSRRDNIILYGIDEQRDENYNACKNKVIAVLNSNVVVKVWRGSDIIRAHRIGRRQEDNDKPCPMIAKLSTTEDKIAVLKHRDDLRKVNIGVANDLTKRQRETIADRKSKGLVAYYKNGKLVTTPANPDRDHPAEIPRRLTRTRTATSIPRTSRGPGQSAHRTSMRPDSQASTPVSVSASAQAAAPGNNPTSPLSPDLDSSMDDS